MSVVVLLIDLVDPLLPCFILIVFPIGPVVIIFLVDLIEPVKFFIEPVKFLIEPVNFLIDPVNFPMLSFIRLPIIAEENVIFREQKSKALP